MGAWHFAGSYEHTVRHSGIRRVLEILLSPWHLINPLSIASPAVQLKEMKLKRHQRGSSWCYGGWRYATR